MRDGQLVVIRGTQPEVPNPSCQCSLPEVFSRRYGKCQQLGGRASLKLLLCAHARKGDLDTLQPIQPLAAQVDQSQIESHLQACPLPAAADGGVADYARRLCTVHELCRLRVETATRTRKSKVIAATADVADAGEAGAGAATDVEAFEQFEQSAEHAIAAAAFMQEAELFEAGALPHGEDSRVADDAEDDEVALVERLASEQAAKKISQGISGASQAAATAASKKRRTAATTATLHSSAASSSDVSQPTGAAIDSAIQHLKATRGKDTVLTEHELEEEALMLLIRNFSANTSNTTTPSQDPEVVKAVAAGAKPRRSDVLLDAAGLDLANVGDAGGVDDSSGDSGDKGDSEDRDEIFPFAKQV